LLLFNQTGMRPNTTIAFMIKILGALSVGDGREKAYPLPAAFPKSLS